jgi:exodeoxyribonuclease-3
MQIITWNVNGIRSVYRKGFLDWFGSEDPDILCLQEIKAKPHQLPEELKMKDDLFEDTDYTVFFNPAQKPGYSGTAIYSKSEPENTTQSLGFEKFDREGRFLTADYQDFKLVNVYMPHGGRDKENLDYKLKAYKKLLQYIKEHQNRNIIICGDLNIAHDERDLARPDDNKTNIMFTEKEREIIEEILRLGFCDTFREVHPEADSYSWFPYAHNAKERNLGWRIDYIFIPENLRKKITTAQIKKSVDMSDHCPVSLALNT